MNIMKEPTTRIEVVDGVSIPDPRDKRLITAWSICLFGAISLLSYLCIRHPESYGVLLSQLPPGILVTFKATLCSFGFTLLIGVVVGIGRLSNNKLYNLVASVYVETVRGVPLLVQIFYIFYALNQLFNVPDFLAAIIALSFCYGAYMGEVFRAGIKSVNKGQSEAARSLGFNKWQTMWYIILPQAWRTIIPPIGNECIALLKDTSLLSVVAIADTFQIAREYASINYLYFEAYTTVALVYLIITLVLSKCVSMVEARLTQCDKR